MDSELIDQLVGMLSECLGLSFYEARAYTALLEKSPISRYELAKMARIPSPKIYDAVQRLYERGLVSQTADEVPLVAPLETQTLLNRLHARQKSSFMQLRELLTEVERSHDKQHRQYFWSASGTQAAYGKAREIIGRCQKLLYIAAFEPDLVHLNDVISAASSRGVSVKALVYGTSPLSSGQVVEHGDVDGVIGRAGGRWLALVCDSNEVMISYPLQGESDSFWTNSPVLSLIISKYIKEHFFGERPLIRDT